MVNTPREPLSSGQQRLWLAHELAPGSVAYNSSFAYRLTGPLDVGALEGALAFVRDRHDALRTRFAVDGGGVPYQLIGERGEFRLPMVDLSGEPAGTDPPWRPAADEPFDLTAGVPLRIVLYRLAANEHVLLVCVHHIIFDGWSQGILIRDLSDAYAALVSGATPHLPAQPTRYADYVRAERDAVAGGQTAAGLAYWRQRLAGAPDTLDLRVERPRPDAAGGPGAAVRFTVPAEVVGPLRALARRENATLYMVALAGYAALLSRYAGEPDVVVGAPAAGRTRIEWEGLIGFFVNALPLRIDLSADPGFGDLVRQTRDAVLGGLTHADVPFERLVQELAPARDPARNAIFQTWCDMFPPDPLPAFGSVAVRPVDAGTQATPFDLGLHLTDEGGPVAGRLLFQPGRFDPPTMRRFTEHYRNLLAAVAADPDGRVSQAPILSSAERDHLLAVGRGPRGPQPDRPLGVLVQERAAATPRAIAVEYGDQRVSYADLNGRANQIATLLRGRGVGPDAVVGLCLPRGIELVVALLGVVKAGGGYLPIDPQFPPARIAFMLADAGTHIVLTHAELAGVLPPAVPRLCLDTERARLDAAPRTDPPPAAVLDHLAYLIYTSGSTGRPKAVAMPQRPLLNLLAWQLARSEVTGPTAQFSSISFDASFLELFATWLAGGRVVLIDEMDRRDPERLLTVLTETGVRRLFCPPLVLEQLARAAANRNVLPPLAELVPAGEQLRLSGQIRALLRRLRNATVDNEYGPAETHVVTAHRLTGDPDPWPDPPPIGRPVTNCEVYLLDRAGQLVPAAVAGEVYLGGPLAWGYLGRPELTAERFVPHPFATAPGQRLYRTGDLARWRVDGTLDFLGRIDDQVKIRGFRVEPGEVAAVLTGHPTVAEAAVVPFQVDDDRRLAAYVVPADATDCDPAELDAYLRTRLPDYLVPNYLVSVPRLPLTTVGKLDRGALPDPVAALAGRRRTEPRTALERLTAEIWAEVLGLPGVGVDQNFFSLGGHSLLAAGAVARLRRALGVDVPLGLLFAHPTVAGLAAALEPSQRAAPAAPSGPAFGTTIPPAADRPPLSPAQQRMWFLHRLDPGNGRYHLPMAYRISGPLDPVQLDRALAYVMDRHEALRTRFPTAGGEAEPYQAIDPPGQVALDVIDVSTGPDPAGAGHAQVLAAASAPFDLAAGPPFRALLVRLGPDEFLLAMVAHHIAFDGWSRRILETELSTAYACLAAGGHPDLPSLPVRYRDYAAWQQQRWSGERLEREITRWRARLAGAPSLLDLPTAWLQQAVPAANEATAPAGRGATVRFNVPGGVAGDLRRLGRARGATLFMVTLAAFGAVLSRSANVSDVVVGTPVAGRTLPELEGLIGLFVNTVPLRIDGPADAPFTELVDHLRETTMDDLAHADLPFERLVEHLAPTRQAGRNPVYQAMFSLSDEPAGPGLELAGLGCTRYELDAGSTWLDLELDLTADGDRLSGRLAYDAKLLDARAMHRLAAECADALASAAAESTAPLRRPPPVHHHLAMWLPS